eukprot:4042849-Pyramimonas_sp.AAC.1
MGGHPLLKEPGRHATRKSGSPRNRGLGRLGPRVGGPPGRYRRRRQGLAAQGPAVHAFARELR